MSEAIALVGGETLLGKEVRDVFGESSLGDRLVLFSDNEDSEGTDKDRSFRLLEAGGEAAIMGRMDPDEVADAAAVLLAGSEASSASALGAEPGGIVIDLTGATEDDPEARVRAPQVEGADYHADYGGPQVVAHPAAIAIALVLCRLQQSFPVQRAVIQVFEPASERGQAGMEELERQTVSLLSLQNLPKDIFAAQLSFNLLPRLGEEAPVQLHDIAERIDRHLATLLERSGSGVPMPSIRLTQAPVFHGYSISFWIEFEDAPNPALIEEALAGEWIDVRGEGTEPPDNAGISGQSGISVGAIEADRNNGDAVWIWLAADNLRLTAETAALIAREAL